MFLGCFACVALSLLCCLGTGGGLTWRYFTAGVNPLRELGAATLGESIQTKDQGDPNGRQHRQLTVDGILHGMQYTATQKPEDKLRVLQRKPTAYYHADGPVGLALERGRWFAELYAADARLPASVVAQMTLNDPLAALAAAWSEPPIGVLMLNTGTFAAYGRPYQFVDFYERSPAIVQLSVPKDGKPPTFTYVDDAKKRGVHVRLFEGNERKTFDQEAPKRFYRYLFVDTAHGHPGLVAKELLTEEALRSYFDALTEDGIVCFHTSSRDYRLVELVAATSDKLKFTAVRVHDPSTGNYPEHSSSEWVFVARKADYLQPVTGAREWLAQRNQRRNDRDRFIVERAEKREAQVWTDAGANSLAELRR
jgi:hypothetical protein